jgi:outer membrane receptor protein involved in Fe transport
MRKFCFVYAVLLAGLMGCSPWSVTARAATAETASFRREVRFDIAPQALATALIMFSRQADVQIAAPAALLEHLTTEGIRGRMPIDAALRQLLSGTRLGFHPVGVNTIGINRMGPGRARQNTTGGARMRPADTTTPIDAAESPGPIAEPAGPEQLTEVIVTATKRPERAGDVAAALTVFSSNTLLDEGYTSFKDFAGLTPGMQVMGSFGSGEPVIRGITSGADTGALVGIVVDGAPIGASSSLTSSGALDALDLDPIDFSNVEILKGPQGTLYGANTLAGIIAYTLRKPDLHHVSAVLRGGRSATEDGEPSYTVRGAASLPIVKGKLAVRVSAYRDFNGGFIDNGTRGIANQNEASHWGAMLSALYRPSEALSIMLTGFFQNFDAVADKVIYNPKTHQPVAGGLAYDAYVYPTSNKQIRVGLANVHYRMSAATLTSVTSYQRIQTADVLNGTGGGLATVLGLLPAFGGQPFPAPGALAMGTGGSVRKFTQELRVNSIGPGPWRWLVGGYYSDERDADQEPMVGRSASGAVLPDLNPAIFFDIFSRYREYSGFGDLTYEITPALSLTGGIRLGHIQQAYSQIFGGSDAAAYNFVLSALGGAATPYSIPLTRSSQNITNYLATARYHFTSRTMLYARFATGFRPGGPNARVNGLPPTFQPDTTKDYEVGLKSAFWHGKAALDLTTYYMKWDGILVPISAHSVSGLGNGGNAESYGVEGDLMLEPIHALTFNLTLAEAHAQITHADTAAAGALGAGDPLPYDPHWSGSLSANYRVHAWGRWQADFGATTKYDGMRHSGFTSSVQIPDYVLPSYVLLDLRAGLNNGRTAVTLYVDNVTNDRAELAATTSFGPTEVTIQRPRTIGALVTLHF